MHRLIFLAVLPSILLAARVLAYDRIAKEPAGLLARLFLIGALTCIPAGIIEAVGMIPIEAISLSSSMASKLTYLFLVPLAEEGVKYLALRTTKKNPNFNYTFDGIVYAVMVGLGFATLENVLYVIENGSVEVAVMRGLLSVPLHCTCAIFMGYFYGVARGQEVRGSREQATRAYWLALIIPCIIHGLYDYSLDTESALSVIAGIGLAVIVFIIASLQVKIASAKDEPIAVSLTTLTSPVPKERMEQQSWRNKGTPPPPFNL